MRAFLKFWVTLAAALAAFGAASALAQTSPVSDLIYVTDQTGAVVFQAPIAEADEESEAVNGVFIHPFPINAGNPAKLGQPILLTEPGTPDYHDGVSDFVAVLPDGQFVFGSAVGPGLIPPSVFEIFTVAPVVMPEGKPVNVTAYIDPAAGFPASYSMYFQSVVPEPSTWAMMAVGFAALGFAAYRRGGRLRRFSGA